jgi:hypothetical protein
MTVWAGDRGHLRASHADREQVVGMLKAAFVQGMLAMDEFDLRVGQALASRTHAELAALTADLPAGLDAAQPARPCRAAGGQPVLRPGQVSAGATMLYAGVWAYIFLFPNGADFPGAPALVFLGGLVYLCLLAVMGAAALENRRDKHSGGQLPRGQAPRAGSPAFRQLPPPGPGRKRSPADPGHYPASQAARRRHPLPPWPVRGHCAGAALAARTAPASS